ILIWPPPALLLPHRLHRPPRPSAASLRTWSDRAAAHPRQARRAFRAQCDSARQANLSLVRRARARSSAPASYAPRLECRQSLLSHLSTPPSPLYAARSSASSACASSPAHTLRAAGDNPPAPVTSISPTPCG